MPHPLSTYRLQFHAGFTFADAAAIVPYLKTLGISHVYASPYLKAKAGSTHGYDVIDHGALNPEVGTQAELDAFLAALRSHGLFHILDIVPNHVGVATNENAWWNDVLENGRGSRFADYFDIAWDASPRLAARGKLLLPVLGEPYGKALEAGKLKVCLDRGGLFVHYFDRRFPLSLETYADVLGPDLAARLPAHDTKTALAILAEQERNVRLSIESNLARLNGTPGDPASFDGLDWLLNRQHFRLASWRVASDEINYRRFFDINDLAALRMERQDVFDATHDLVFRLIREGKLDGLRVDHPDGLYDPRQYLQWLQTASPVPKLYVVVEKILAGGEPLPSDWPVAGTTGYDFLAAANGLFVDPSAEPALTRIYRQFTGEHTEYRDIVYRNKRQILLNAFSSELRVLSLQLDCLAQRDRMARDFTFRGLRDALVEIVACFPVYRSYITAAGVHDADVRYIEEAIERAIRRNPNMSGEVFSFIRGMLLQKRPRHFTDEDHAAQLRFAGKFQQLTAPVTAKGIEDTAFYNYQRLISLNEVGGDPGQFGTKPASMHEYLHDRQQRWPDGLSPLSTHDTKRSEDVRARINVLSELPDQWERMIVRWRELNAGHRGDVHPNDEYLIYQTLVGVWPLNVSELPGLVSRVQAYLQKALREGKQRTSWINPNDKYENAVSDFIARILDPQSGPGFLNEFRPFQQMVSTYGLYNSLSQTLLRLTAPGVPDTYQGSELWDFSLVDPDNRRSVDFAKRAKMLSALNADMACAGHERTVLTRELLDTREDGRIKLFTITRALQCRRENPDLFSKGEYIPLTAIGPKRDYVFAFARKYRDKQAIVIIPRLYANLLRNPVRSPIDPAVWADTFILLSSANRNPAFIDIYSGLSLDVRKQNEGQVLGLSEALAHFPVALLVA